MTKRERVVSVLNHELPDAIPNAWGGCETAGLHVMAYDLLKEVVGAPSQPTRVDTFMFNAVASPEVLTAMGGDLLLIASPSMCSRPIHGPDAGWAPYSLFGGRYYMTDDHSVELAENGYTYLVKDGRRFMHCPEGGRYFDFIPTGDMMDFEDLPDPKSLSYRRLTNDEKLRQLEETAKHFYEATDFALNCGEAICDLQLMPGGMVGWYDAMINEPERTAEFLGRAAEAGIEDVKALDQAVGKYCCMLSIAHDLGDRRGVTIGPELFRSVYKPAYKQLFKGWHRHTKMKINMHSCGSVSDILKDLIECGLDVFNPVQVSCDRMDPKDLKARYGKDLVFYGGAYDAVQTPPTTDPERVYAQVKANILQLAEGGGYLFAAVHNTPADTPKSHIEAILQAYRDVRQHPACARRQS